MADFFSTSLQANSIILIFVSAAIGASLTAVTNFMFQSYIPEKRRLKMTKYALETYFYPILNASYSLSTATENIKLTEYSNNEYFRLRILYLFACFLGWCKILENESLINNEALLYKAFQGTTLSQAFIESRGEFSWHSTSWFSTFNWTTYSFGTFFKRKFEIKIIGRTIYSKLLNKFNERENLYFYLYLIFSLISGQKFSNSIPPEILAATGECVIERIGNTPTVISFVSFIKKYSEEKDLQSILSNIDNFFVSNLISNKIGISILSTYLFLLPGTLNPNILEESVLSRLASLRKRLNADEYNYLMENLSSILEIKYSRPIKQFVDMHQTFWKIFNVLEKKSEDKLVDYGDLTNQLSDALSNSPIHMEFAALHYLVEDMYRMNFIQSIGNKYKRNEKQPHFLFVGPTWRLANS